MTFLESLATTIGIVASFAMIPQAVKIFKRKSSKDISISSNSFMLVAGVIWTLYGFEIKSMPLILTNLCGSIILIVIIGGCFLYRKDINDANLDE